MNLSKLPTTQRKLYQIFVLLLEQGESLETIQLLLAHAVAATRKKRVERRTNK
jgi:hypothetical protein